MTYPIAQDNEMGTWRVYSNRARPAKYLVGKDGFVRYKHFGEGSYQETERQIRDELRAAGAVCPMCGRALRRSPSSILRQETRTWTSESLGRSTVASHAIIAALDYKDPEEHNNHYVYLQGPWFNGLEELRHGRETQNYEDYLALKFSATSVNAVINAADAPPFKV